MSYQNNNYQQNNNNNGNYNNQQQQQPQQNNQTVIGFVEVLNQKPTRNNRMTYSAKVNGTWYGHGFNIPSFQQGDEIEFVTVTNGQYINIDTNSVRVLGSGGGQNQGGNGNNNGQGNQGNQPSNQAYNPQRNSTPNNNQQGGGNQGGGSNNQGNNGQNQSNNQPQQQNGGYQNRSNGQGNNRAATQQAGGREQYWEDKAVKDIQIQRTIQFQASRNAAINTLGVLLEHKLVSVPQAKAKQYDAVMALLDVITQAYEKQTTAVFEGNLGEVFKEMEEKGDFQDYNTEQAQQQQNTAPQQQNNPQPQQNNATQGYDDDIPQ